MRRDAAEQVSHNFLISFYLFYLSCWVFVLLLKSNCLRGLRHLGLDVLEAKKVNVFGWKLKWQCTNNQQTTAEIKCEAFSYILLTLIKSNNHNLESQGYNTSA